MSLYEKYCLPALINWACSGRGVARLRAEMVGLAAGRVLEVGMGGGVNLPFYDSRKVTAICGIEPNEAMRHKALQAAKGTSLQIEVLPASAEALPLPDDSFDTVLVTFTLCTILDWRRGLLEMARVMKPEARLVFCEHGLAPDRGLADWQHRLNRYWRAVAGGCNLDRSIPDLLAEAGFRVEQMKAGYAPGLPRIAGYVYRGVAVK